MIYCSECETPDPTIEKVSEQYVRETVEIYVHEYGGTATDQEKYEPDVEILDRCDDVIYRCDCGHETDDLDTFIHDESELSHDD